MRSQQEDGFQILTPSRGRHIRFTLPPPFYIRADACGLRYVRHRHRGLFHIVLFSSSITVRSDVSQDVHVKCDFEPSNYLS